MIGWREWGMGIGMGNGDRDGERGGGRGDEIKSEILEGNYR